MIKFFCNKCGAECTSHNSAVRTFSGLADAVGLDVVPTLNGVQGAEGHVCEDCVPELLLIAAKQYPNFDTAAKQTLLIKEVTSTNKLGKALERRIEAADEREQAAKEKIAEAEKRIALADQQQREDTKTIEMLQAQVGALRAKLETAETMRLASAKQYAEENPAYLASMARRENLRTSKPQPATLVDPEETKKNAIERDDMEYEASIQRRERIRLGQRP